MFWLIYGIMFIFKDQGLNFYSCYVAIKYGRDIWWTLEQNWVNRISSPFSIMIDVNLFNDNSKRKTSRKWLTVAIWLSWTVMDFHGWLSWMTVMDDFHGWQNFAFYKLFLHIDDRLTLVLVKSLSRLKMWESRPPPKLKKLRGSSGGFYKKSKI